MRHAALLWSLSVLSMLGTYGAAADEASKATHPYVTLSGTDSQIKEAGCFLVTTEAEWINLWQRHKGVPESDEYNRFYNPLGLPEVDFDQCTVIAIFQGTGCNNAGLKPTSLKEETARVILRFENRFFQTLSTSIPPADSKPGVIVDAVKAVNVYGFFVIPKTSKTLVVEEGTSQLIGAPLEWKQRPVSQWKIALKKK